MDSLTAYFVVLFAATTIFAVKFEVRGTVNCNCLNCHSVANVQLWEEDTIDPDDRLDEMVVMDSAFGLKFDYWELFGIDPYLLVRHDCSPDLWDLKYGRKRKGKEFCFVQKRHDFKIPTDDKRSVRVDFSMGGLLDENRDMEICVPETKFRRIFGGGPLSINEPEIVRGPACWQRPECWQTRRLYPDK